MKAYLFLILFPLISFGSCIEFSGTYRCSTNQGNGVRKYTTEKNNGIFIYEFSEESGESLTFFADGSRRAFELEEQGMKLVGSITSECDSRNLESYFDGKVAGDSGRVEIKMNTSKSGEKINTSLTIFYNGRHVQTVNESCSNRI